MKVQSVAALAALGFMLSAPVHAASSLQDLKKVLTKPETTESATSSASESVDLSGLISSVSSNLGVTEAQSEGGLASLFNYVKGNLSGTDYSELAGNIPGLEGLLSSVPETSGSSSSKSDALYGLLNKASEYSSTAKSINDLKQQFEALGLTPEMISSFVSQASSYFRSENNTETQSIFQSGLDNLLSAL